MPTEFSIQYAGRDDKKIRRSSVGGRCSSDQPLPLSGSLTRRLSRLGLHQEDKGNAQENDKGAHVKGGRRRIPVGNEPHEGHTKSPEGIAYAQGQPGGHALVAGKEGLAENHDHGSGRVK